MINPGLSDNVISLAIFSASVITITPRIPGPVYKYVEAMFDKCRSEAHGLKRISIAKYHINKKKDLFHHHYS